MGHLLDDFHRRASSKSLRDFMFKFNKPDVSIDIYAKVSQYKSSIVKLGVIATLKMKLIFVFFMTITGK